MSENIADGTVVAFHYTLTVDGDVIDSSDGGQPLSYLHGAQNIVPGLERQLLGRKVGDAFAALVPAAEGYGEKSASTAQRVPKSAFPPDAKLSVGASFMAQSSDGQPMRVFIVGVQGDEVLIDAGHPLAGKALMFDVTIVSIRSATTEETAHGHPHGPGGHHH